jgi:hypothetical protein
MCSVTVVGEYGNPIWSLLLWRYCSKVFWENRAEFCAFGVMSDPLA